ncbi:unnamed protein product [Caenorhabditis brenneri]
MPLWWMWMPPPTSRSSGRFYALTALIIIFSLLRRTRRQGYDDIFNTSQSPGHTLRTSSSFKSFGTLSSDELGGNGEYEIAVRIVHNCCDPSNPYRNLEVFVGNFKNEEVHYQKDIGSVEIHNKGNPTKDVIGKKKKKNNQFIYLE